MPTAAAEGKRPKGKHGVHVAASPGPDRFLFSDLPTREVEMSTWELADDMYNCDGLIHDYHTLDPNSISAQRARSIAAGRAAAAELGLVAPVAAAAAGRALAEDAAATQPTPPANEPPGVAPAEANIATAN